MSIVKGKDSVFRKQAAHVVRVGAKDIWIEVSSLRGLSGDTKVVPR